MRRTKEAAMETKRRILDAALDIFSEKNFSNVSVSEIADKVNMTKGAVYWHFRNKEDILVRLIEDFCVRTNRDFIDRYGLPEKLDELRGYYQAMMTLPRQDDQFYKIQKLLLRRMEWPEELQKQVQELLVASGERSRAMVHSLLVKAYEGGEISEPKISLDDAALLITAAFHGLFVLQMSELLPKDFSEPTDFMIDAFVSALKKK